MCTAIACRTTDAYFGRNLDLEYGYNETVTITPRNHPFQFRCVPNIPSHYAMIGMATVVDGSPLYYEAANEKGLCIAGLNFPGNAVYLPENPQKVNIASFELIPWLLGQAANLDQARTLLSNLNIVNIPFSKQFPPTPLHWIISDGTGSIVVEPMAEGLQIYENPIGILTNNPPFDYHMYHLRQYMHLSPKPATNHFSPNHTMEPFSGGMAAIGLPGDWSSTSRFVRAAFVKLNSVAESSENSSVSQFFHMLSSVAMPRGSVLVQNGTPDITRYSCCINATRGIYYYTTYDNCQITAVYLHREDLSGNQPISYPLRTQLQIQAEKQTKDGDPHEAVL